MSTDLYEDGGLAVTQLCGPERKDGGDRRNYQFTMLPDGEWCVLTFEQARTLAVQLAHFTQKPPVVSPRNRGKDQAVNGLGGQPTEAGDA